MRELLDDRRKRALKITFVTLILLITVPILLEIIIEEVLPIIKDYLVLIGIEGIVGILEVELLGEATLWFQIVVWLIVTPIVVFALIFFVLTPANLWFTFVDEGTVKFVVRAGKFHKILLQFEGKTFAYYRKHPERWTIIEGQEHHPFGGLRFYGFWPLDDIQVYHFRWSSLRPNGEVVEHSEWLDYMMVMDDLYFMKIKGAEDINQLQLDVELILTIAIKNPYLAKYKIQNWLEAVIDRIKPYVTEYITKRSFEEWIKRKGILGKEITIALNPIIQELLTEYGVEIKKIEVVSIDPPKEYYETIIKPYLAEKEKEAQIIAAQAEKARINIVYPEIRKQGEHIRLIEAVERSKLENIILLPWIGGMVKGFRNIFKKNKRGKKGGR